MTPCLQDRCSDQLSYSGARPATFWYRSVTAWHNCNGRLPGGYTGCMDHSGIEGAPTGGAPCDPGAERPAGTDLEGFRRHAVHQGVNPLLYWALRAVLVPFFLVYFRLERIGREHLPRRGPLLLAANHRSFLDPFVIGALQRRPVYYMAKRELFEKPWQARLLNALGAFPVDRGAGDREAMDTARAILERGDCVVIFPEGTRTRPGPLGEPRRGVGRLALETGAPVAPVAVIGTERVRSGWLVRPRRVRLRVGMPLRFPTVDQPSPQLAAGVTRRMWDCVSLQWEWLGGARAPRAHGAHARDDRHERAPARAA